MSRYQLGTFVFLSSSAIYGAPTVAPIVEDTPTNPLGKYGRSKLTEEQVLEIRRLYAAGDHTQRQLSEKFGTTRPNIGQIVRRVTWRHI